MPSQINLNPLRMLDANGDPVPGAKVYFYESGTTTPLTVYTDSSLSTAHPTPLIADAEGILERPWTSGTPQVKVDVKDPANVTLNGYPLDPAPLIASTGSAAAAVSFAPITGNSATDVQGAIANLTGLWNAVTTFGKTLVAAADAAAARATLGLTSMATVTLLDEDGMASDSATQPASQQSIKAYVDNSLARGGASVATTSGTAINISTAIPAGVAWVEVMFSGVSLSGTNDILIQISTGGTFKTTGYVSESGRMIGAALAVSSSTAGFIVNSSLGGNEARGVMRIVRASDAGFSWIESHANRLSTTSAAAGGGEVSLGGTLDGIRITTTGANTFDAGTVYVRWGK
ncbi:MAG: hypothetical protein ACPG4X_19310 [Pikeienuella sp.]